MKTESWERSLTASDDNTALLDLVGLARDIAGAKPTNPSNIDKPEQIPSQARQRAATPVASGREAERRLRLERRTSDTLFGASEE